MKTLIIGDMNRVEELYDWMEISQECFEVELIISENKLESKSFTCPVESLMALKTIENVYDIIFICSDFYPKYEKILLMCGISQERIVSKGYTHRGISKADKMNHYTEVIQKEYTQIETDTDILQIGEFTYGSITISGGEKSGSKVLIGKFCSIASGVSVILDEHNSNWCSTYPFNMFVDDYMDLKGHPKSKGDVIIGNDVWVGMNSMILSGVHIGNDAIIAAGAIVTKDVEPYSIVGGNPARVIKKRFDDTIIKRMEEIEWWNWKKEYIYDAIPILQSNNINKLFEYYDNVVSV